MKNKTAYCGLLAVPLLNVQVGFKIYLMQKIKINVTTKTSFDFALIMCLCALIMSP